jgi:hypothetical protein
MNTELRSSRSHPHRSGILWGLAAVVLLVGCATGSSLLPGLEDGSIPGYYDAGLPDVLGIVLLDGNTGDAHGGSCGAGYALCSGECVSLTTTAHCGSCDNVCVGGDTCNGGICESGGSGTGTTSPDSGGSDDTGVGPDDSGGGDTGSGGCGAGETMCDGICTNTDTDPDNCGMCGKQCSSNMCSGGTCAAGSNDAGGGGSGYTCSHSPCSVGGALQENCDEGDDDLVSQVCSDIPSCCTSSWTNDCVNDMEEYCECPFFGSACIDPGCS